MTRDTSDDFTGMPILSKARRRRDGSTLSCTASDSHRTYRMFAATNHVISVPQFLSPVTPTTRRFDGHELRPQLPYHPRLKAWDGAYYGIWEHPHFEWWVPNKTSKPRGRNLVMFDDLRLYKGQFLLNVLYNSAGLATHFFSGHSTLP